MYHSKRVAATSKVGRKNFLSPTKASLSRKNACRIVDRRSKKHGHKSKEGGTRIIKIYNDATEPPPSAPQATSAPMLSQAPKTQQGVKVFSPPRQTLNTISAGKLGDNAALKSSKTQKSKVAISSTNLQKENAINATDAKFKEEVNVRVPKVQSKNSILKDREQKITLRGPWKLHKEETTSLRAKVAKQTEDLTVANTYHEVLRKKLLAATESYSKLNEAYVQLKSQNENLHSKFHCIEIEKNDLLSANEEMKKTAKDSDEQINTLLAQLANSLEANRKLETMNSKFEDDNDVANKEIQNMAKLYDNLEMENETHMERINVLERRVDIMKKDRSRLEHHISILSKEKERLHSQVKELERGARSQANLSEMKRREKNWSTDTNNNDVAINTKGSERLGKFLRLTQPNMSRKMNIIVKKLQDEEALSSRLMQSNREKDAKIANLTNRIRNMERYNTRNNM